MNRQVVIIIGVLVVAVAAGAGYMIIGKKSQPNVPVTTSSESESEQQTGGLFTSLQDALSKSLTLECSFTDERGLQTKVAIKNGAVRTDMTGKTAAESGSVIVKDKKMYFWNSQMGFMMELPEVDADAPLASAQGSVQYADMMAAVEKYKDSCKPAVVADSLFTPPAEVKFQDFSAIMPVSTPGSAPAIDQAELQKMMEQYSGEQE